MKKVKDELLNRFQYLWNNRIENINAIFREVNAVYEQIPENNEAEKVLGANILGYCYWRFSDYPNALKYSLIALQLARKLKDLKAEANALNNLGAVYMFQNKNQKRLDCNLKCLAIRREIGDLDSISGSENNIGETYFEMGDLEEASIWFKKSILTLENSTWAYFNLGKVAVLNEDYELGLSYFEKALSIAEVEKDEVLLLEIYLEISSVYYVKKEYKKSKKLVKLAISFSKKIRNKEYAQKGYLQLSLLAEKQGDFKQSLYYHKQYHKLYEELFNEAKNKEIKDLLYREEIKKISEESILIKQKSEELSIANIEIEKQRNLIEIKNANFIDSVTYAKRIQDVYLNNHNELKTQNFDSFLFFKPKDIVSGDFYWSKQIRNYTYLVVADCTGHGVPGGFLTMLSIAYLDKVVTSRSLDKPNLILEKLRKNIIRDVTGKQNHRDGMDISFLRINNETLEIDWAGAYNPLWIMKEETDEVLIIKGNREAIGYSEKLKPFTNHHLQLKKNDQLYLFSDGFVDQFGGRTKVERSNGGKKIGRRNFKKLLLSIKTKNVAIQKKEIQRFFDHWKGEEEQIDDVCVMGIKL